MMLKKHLSLSSATWDAERSASMRYIAKSYKGLDDDEHAKLWLFKAIKETPYLREGYIELAMQFYQENDWLGVAFMIEKALEIKERPLVYMTEPKAWDYTPYDLGAISQYQLGNYEKALIYAQKALSYRPTDERLQRNYEVIAMQLS